MVTIFQNNFLLNDHLYYRAISRGCVCAGISVVLRRLEAVWDGLMPVTQALERPKQESELHKDFVVITKWKESRAGQMLWWWGACTATAPSKDPSESSQHPQLATDISNSSSSIWHSWVHLHTFALSNLDTEGRQADLLSLKPARTKQWNPSFFFFLTKKNYF